MIYVSGTKRGRGKYCSLPCYYQSLIGKPSWNKGRKGLYEHTKEWKEKARRRMSGKYNPFWKGGIQKKTCPYCKQEFQNKNLKYCSKKCYSANIRGKPNLAIKGKPNFNLRGKNNPNWKGGTSRTERQVIASRIEYRLWRKAVFERDDYTCQKCKERGGKIRAHHIHNFARYLELRLVMNNGITLCKICHNNFHSIYGKTDTTKEQLQEFLDK